MSPGCGWWASRRTNGRARSDAIVVMCTNLAGAGLVEPLGAELGVPILDSVRASIDHCVARLRAG